MKKVAPSKEVADLRAVVQPAAVAKYGYRWVAGLARETQIPVRSLHTFFYRGQTIRADYRDKIFAALGLSNATRLTLGPGALVITGHPVEPRVVEVETICRHVREQLTRVFERSTPKRRDALVRHLLGQVTLLATLASESNAPRRHRNTR